MVPYLLSVAPWAIGVAVIVGIGILFMILSASWRVVVPNNEVHIVQRNKTSTSYGSQQEKGNVYWKFPYWLPVIGTYVQRMPVSIFQIELDGYEAYDQEKVPFSVDVISFFHIEDPVSAAKRVSSDSTMDQQLQNVLRGSVRKVLASKDINTIMETRSELNSTFLAEVSHSVQNWGVKVLSIEFIDIHDASGTHVITDIMNRKKSKIEKESRMEVADNMRDAQLKEIEAKQTTELRAVEAQQAVQTRDAERVKEVGVAQQVAEQLVKEEARKTKEKEIAVNRAAEVGQAQYQKEKLTIEAESAAIAQVRREEGAAKSAEINAEGYRLAQLKKAEGDAKLIGETGKAEADVIKAKGMAQAEAALKNAEALAKIQKEGLQAQLGEKAIEAHKAIGVALAAAYSNAEIKAVLTNGGGIESLSDLLSTGGGGKLGAFVEALKSVSGGANVLEALGMKSLVPEVKKSETK